MSDDGMEDGGVWEDRALAAEAEVERLKKELQEAKEWADSPENPLWDRAWFAGESRSKAEIKRLRDVLRQIASCDVRAPGDVVSVARAALGEQ
jgi:hypothetical protein